MRPVVAVLVVAATIAAGALVGLGITELTDADGDGRADRQPRTTAREEPEVVGGAGQEQEGRQEPERPRRERGVPTWPRDLTAHTVVLVNSGDRAAALNVAKEARASGLEAGLMPSDPYDLGTGLWIVYSGQFTTPEGAARQASQLAERYPGAYPVLVQRSQ
jgi:hypothetical protein